MPTYIVKPDRDEDFYVEWSSVVDNIVGAGGDRASMLRFGAERVRLDRADASGTSALWPDTQSPYLGWGDNLLVTNTERDDAHFFTLRRGDLLAYARAYDADDVASAERLLVPCPADDAEDVGRAEANR